MSEIHVDGYMVGSNPSNEGGITIASETNVKTYNIKQNGITNNQTEIIACIIGMLEKEKTIVSDSQIAVNCLNGKWEIHQDTLKPLVNLGKIILKIRKKNLVWRRRDTNLAGIYNENTPIKS